MAARMALNAPKQRQGGQFEQRACQFLQEHGLILIARNWQQPTIGELDLVMLEQGQAWSTLVFIEVRQRVRSGFGDAALTVTAAKQRKIIKTAQYFLQQHPHYADYECRFDVIAYNTKRTDNAKTDYQPEKYQLEKYQPEWLQGAFITSAW